MYQQDPWSSPPQPVPVPPTTGLVPPGVPPAPLPSPTPTPPPGRRRTLIVAGIGGIVLALAAAGTLFASGVVNLSGTPENEKSKESARAKPDEPSINPDDTRYDVAGGLCDELDATAYEAMVPGPEKMTGELEEDPYLTGGTEIKCEQTFATEKQFVYLTVKVIAFPSVLRARLDGYAEYSTSAFKELVLKPSWVDGDWEKAEIIEANETDLAETAFIAQDDNLAMAITVESKGVEGIEQADTTDAVLATANEVLNACET